MKRPASPDISPAFVRPKPPPRPPSATTTIAASMPLTPSYHRRILMPKPSEFSSLTHSPRHRATFYDLPAELRIEVYKLVLDRVTLHILPPRTAGERLCPHALLRTSKQVRNEVLPIMHAQCPIRCTVTDFNFDGLLEWMNRLPSDQERNLCRNTKLSIELVTTVNDSKHSSSNSMKNSQSLRRWLHLRADLHRPQPAWKYKGPTPDPKTAYEMKRRAKRATKVEEQNEMCVMLSALGLRITAQATSSTMTTDDQQAQHVRSTSNGVAGTTTVLRPSIPAG